MGGLGVLLFVCAVRAAGDADERYYLENKRLAKTIVEALQDSEFDEELLFDLKKDNEVFPNRTISYIIKYIIKREVDNYRSRRSDAISRRVFSALVMKLIDIAKDLPRNTSTVERIEHAHHYYLAAESRDAHDQLADTQLFHACARLYDILFTTPRILSQLGRAEYLTARSLLSKLKKIDVQPVHLGVALVLQFHMRDTANYAIRTNALEVLSTEPKEVDTQVVSTLKGIAARLLPVAELLDIHLAHSSPAFKDTCPDSWLGIVHNKHL